MKLSYLLKPGMRGVFYGRFSTDKQNMDAQRSQAIELIKKYQCECVDEYLDEARSARKSKLEERDGVSRLLSDAHLGRYDFVVISQHDRIARDPVEHVVLRSTFAQYKISVIIASSESLYDSGDLILDTLRDGNSKLEVENTRVRTKNTMDSLLKLGVWRGGTPPFGYKYDKETKKFYGIEPELQQVKEIFELYLRFDGFDAIAQKLPFGSYRGLEWTDQAVRAIITNPFYAGYLTSGRKKSKANNSFEDRSKWKMIYSDKIPAVISLDKWERCWDLYQSRIEGSAAPNKYKTSFLLRDLLVCLGCNHNLVTKDQTTTSKKGEVYGGKIYRCLQCKYTVNIDDAHKIIDFLLNDIKHRNEDLIVEEVFSSIEEDIKLLELEKYELLLAGKQLQERVDKINAELKEQFDLYKNVLSVGNDEETEKKSIETVIRIVNMSGENVKNQIHSIQQRIQLKEDRVKRTVFLNGHPEYVRSRVKEMKTVPRRSELMRGLLLELIRSIGINNEGFVSIETRYDVFHTHV